MLLPTPPTLLHSDSNCFPLSFPFFRLVIFYADLGSCFFTLLVFFHIALSATKGHARIKDTYANLSQLKSALDPVVADKRIEAEDLQMGMNLVLSDEERIRDISAKLEQVQTLNAVAMDSEPIHNVPKMTERLNKLVELTIDQQGDAQVCL